MQDYLDNIIDRYLETKKILLIISDFNRDDKVRDMLLKNVSIEQLLIMDNFVSGLEDKGIKEHIRFIN